MLNLLLQVWGGLFYLLNKVFFSRAERSKNSQGKQKSRFWAWAFYLIGVPAWVIVLVSGRNWIAAAIETGGSPAMLVGLINARRGQGHAPLWLDHFAKLALAIGLGLSLYDFGGLTSLSQVLELGMASGFLMGTYLLSKDKPHGYFWLMLGNITCAGLMGIQAHWLLLAEQTISLGFVFDAYWVQRRRLKIRSNN